jgi:hypothetical protein
VPRSGTQAGIQRAKDQSLAFSGAYETHDIAGPVTRSSTSPRRRALEIGTFTGYSALAVGAGAARWRREAGARRRSRKPPGSPAAPRRWARMTPSRSAPPGSRSPEPAAHAVDLGEGVRDQHRLLDRPAHRGDPTGLVHGGPTTVKSSRSVLRSAFPHSKPQQTLLTAAREAAWRPCQSDRSICRLRIRQAKASASVPSIPWENPPP